MQWGCKVLVLSTGCVVPRVRSSMCGCAWRHINRDVGTGAHRGKAVERSAHLRLCGDAFAHVDHLGLYTHARTHARTDKSHAGTHSHAHTQAWHTRAHCTRARMHAHAHTCAPMYTVVEGTQPQGARLTCSFAFASIMIATIALSACQCRQRNAAPLRLERTTYLRHGRQC